MTQMDVGPIDFLAVELPGAKLQGRGLAALVDLTDRGIIRILDVAFLGKDENGAAYAVDIADIDAADAFGVFDGASSGLLREEDLAEAASVLEPGTTAAVLVWENRWAAPVAVAIRKSGGQLVASGRIPVQAIIASLDALEAGD